jgi:ElaB/YqjD/DUF883 family membrane-anchored ribosome-binding protein
MATNTATTGNQKQQIDRLTESAHSAIDRATQTASQVAQQFSERGEEYLAMKDEYVESAREYVRENPFMALGIALAAGYLFGKISSWR